MGDGTERDPPDPVDRIWMHPSEVGAMRRTFAEDPSPKRPPSVAWVGLLVLGLVVLVVGAWKIGQSGTGTARATGTTVGALVALPTVSSSLDVPGGSEPPARLGITGRIVATGVEVLEVESGGPAARAGISLGDVVQAVGGRRIVTLDDLSGVLAAARGGETLQFTVFRGSVTLTLAVTVARGG